MVRKFEQGSQKGEMSQDSRRGISQSRFKRLCTMERQQRSRENVDFGVTLT